jgi:hypothetical protein
MASPQSADMTLIDAKVFCNVFLFCLPFQIHNFLNLIVGKFCFVMRTPIWPATTAFPHHVLRVLQRGSWKKVVWIDAQRIVARVANINSFFWGLPGALRKGKYMSANCFFSIKERPVSAKSCAGPKPTRFCSFDVVVKALRHCHTPGWVDRASACGSFVVHAAQSFGMSIAIAFKAFHGRLQNNDAHILSHLKGVSK